MSSAIDVKEKPLAATGGQLNDARRSGSLGDALATRRWLTGLILVLLDLAILWAAHDVMIRWNFNEFLAESHWILLIIPALSLLPVIYIIGGFDSRTDMRGLSYTSEHLMGALIALTVSALIIYGFAAYGAYVRPSRGALVGTFGIFIPFSLAHRWLITPWIASRSSRKTFLVLGTGPTARTFYDAYQTKPNRQRLVFLDPNGDRVGQHLAGEESPVIEGDAVERLHALGSEHDGVIVAEGVDDLSAEVRDTLVRIHFEKVPVYTLETFYETHWRMVPVFALNPLWALQMGFQFTRDYPYVYIKRMMDLVLSGLGLILSAPVMFCVAIAVYIDTGRPILFRQHRIGRDRQPFTVLKFRTMRNGSESGSPFTVQGDDRITRLGRWLRRFRLDELPQFWNVFRGDMSLIGPRAESAECVAQYEALIPSYHLRHLVKPGITGWAQVNYGYGAGSEDAVEKLKYDLYYIRHHSLLLDAMIVLRTLYVMLAARGR